MVLPVMWSYRRFDENKETGGWFDKDGWGFDLKLALSKLQHKYH
eukprot:COSAG02_NODE_59511_length_274_cov_0.588571_1_plen_44_part_00